jgi:hypothetical protein
VSVDFRVIRALLAAVAVAFLLGERSFTEFEKIRFKAVEAPIASSNRSLILPIDDLQTRNLVGGDPDALIATIQNGGAAGDVVIQLDGAPVCKRRVAAGRSRIDCAVTQWVPGRAAHELAIDGPHESWSLTYLEMATHHGNTSGINYLVVLPRESTRYGHPSSIGVVAGGLGVLFLLLFAKPASFPLWGTFLHRSASVLAVTALSAIAVAPFVSPFLVVVSIQALTCWLMVIFFDRLWPMFRWFAISPVNRTTQIARAVTVGILVSLTFWLPVRQELKKYGGNYSGFLRISREAFETNPLIDDRDQLRRDLILVDNSGYDGQFMYYMAFDPWLLKFRSDPRRYRETVDAPPYRFGRMGFSLLTRLAARSPSRYPATMIWLLIITIGALACVLSLEAQNRELTPLAGAIVVLIPGFWTSLLSGLPEPLAAAAMVFGMLLWEHGRLVAAGLLLAASLLIRETGVIFLVCMVVGIALTHGVKRAVLIACLAFGPLVLWRSYVVLRLFPEWGTQVFTAGPADFDWPFAGVRDLWVRISSGGYYNGSTQFAWAGLTYPMLLTAGLLLAFVLVWSRPRAMSIAAILYGVLAVCFNYMMVWALVTNAQRLTYELFVALALCTLYIRSYSLAVRRSVMVFWCASAWFAFYGTTEPILSAFIAG